jgi:2-polyprenyl-3-methyl-5-hydroxy-6-metoxy-1,4-benzoquinol methylase
VDDYWNHNTAYHDAIVAMARRRPGRVLDVGCGEGLLVQRLARVARHVTRVDPDAAAVARARERTATLANATLCVGDFVEMSGSPWECARCSVQSHTP